MKSSLLLPMLLSVVLVHAQQVRESFYKDIYLTKEVAENKAGFKMVETISSDGVKNIQVFNVSKNCLVREENYVDDRPVGVWTRHSENCSLVSKLDFTKLVYSDKKVDSLYNNTIKEGNPENYEKAMFGDSEDGIFQYLANNIKYPAEARESGISGRVYLQFIIASDGSVRMVSVVRSAHPFLDLGSWELIESMPKWKPAKKDGVPIDSYYVLPINYTLK